MTQPTPSLAEFLLARIAEDEAVADGASKDGLPVRGRSHWEWQQLASKPNTSLIAQPDGGTGLRPGDVIRDDRVSTPVADHIARWDPARVLAECTAKRRIVEWHTGRDGCCEERLGPLVVDPDPTVSVSANAWGDLVARRSIGHQQRIGCVTLLLLAAPYADHPDFRQEWRP
jgi:hypothetical protein